MRGTLGLGLQRLQAARDPVEAVLRPSNGVMDVRRTVDRDDDFVDRSGDRFGVLLDQQPGRDEGDADAGVAEPIAQRP